MPSFGVRSPCYISYCAVETIGFPVATSLSYWIFLIKQRSKAHLSKIYDSHMTESENRTKKCGTHFRNSTDGLSKKNSINDRS